VMKEWQMFRAGIEGTISGLKRAFRLVRCYYRGFKSFEASVGLGVFTHNLIVLANMGET
jgi:DDE family transposase